MPDREGSVVALEDASTQEVNRGSACFVRRQLGRAAGSRQRGVSHMGLAPGATRFPFHWHGVNEEAIYVLEGAGTLRLGDARLPVASGDDVAAAGWA